MQAFKLRKGADIPIEGVPDQTIHDKQGVNSVALLGADYVGLKPRLLVAEGDEIRRGAPVFFHKDQPDVMVTSPVSGKVVSINRGARRVLQSVVVEISDAEDGGVDFSDTGREDTAEGLTEKLCLSGLWTSFRTRPYSKVPDPGTKPAAIFVTALDTEPLCADASLVLSQSAQYFERGLAAISHLTDGDTFLCRGDTADAPGQGVTGVTDVVFSGPHPAGLAGTHIHFLHPPTDDEVVWTIGYQDVIEIGHLLESGHRMPTRIVAIGGPVAKQPRLLKTVQGASLLDLTNAEVDDTVPAVRIISGSVLSGRAGVGPEAYLGRYARQVTLIEEDRKQHVLGWVRPMPEKFAIQPVLGSAFKKRLFNLTSNLNGGRRAMVPTGTFETLMPQDYLPTQLLRALLVKDTDTAQALGVMELDEEDLGLVGFACPAKYEYGIALRDCLEKIEKEG
jgi:Na+-transporting NADH:ubiquinone oxidoreductase subunit A